MAPEAAREMALRLIRFLETGKEPLSLFVEHVFCDFTPPPWREPVVALRRRGHPGSSQAPLALRLRAEFQSAPAN